MADVGESGRAEITMAANADNVGADNVGAYSSMNVRAYSCTTHTSTFFIASIVIILLT